MINSKIDAARQSVPSFDAMYGFFCKHLQNENLSESTIINYTHHLARLCLHFGRIPEEISGEEYVNYYNELIHANTGRSSMLHAVFSVRKYFKVFGIECPLGANPTIKGERRIPVVLSQREIRDLLGKTTDLEEKTLLGLLYDTGCRKSEALSLKIGDLDFDRGRILVRCGKGRKDRYVPFSENMQAVMSAYLKRYTPSAYVFEKAPGVQKSKAWPTRVLASAVSRASILKEVHVHTLRHCFAVHLLEHGVDIIRIQEWLGHRRLETTAIYLKVADVQYDRRWVGPTDLIFPVKPRK